MNVTEGGGLGDVGEVGTELSNDSWEDEGNMGR